MRERLSLLLIRLASWCLQRAVTAAPEGAAVVLAVAHGSGRWSHLWHAGTASQALDVAVEARHQAWHAEGRSKEMAAKRLA